jgi:membrane-bound serine protease (ClpP class)
MVVESQRKKPVTGKEGLIGEIGVTNTPIDPIGEVFVHGEIWYAESDEKIEKGDKIEILSIDGMKLKVKKVS